MPRTMSVISVVATLPPSRQTMARRCESQAVRVSHHFIRFHARQAADFYCLFMICHQPVLDKHGHTEPGFFYVRFHLPRILRVTALDIENDLLVYDQIPGF